MYRKTFPFKLSLSSDAWDLYVGYLEKYVFTKEWAPHHKTLALIRCADLKTFQVMKLLCHPDDPYKKSFNTLAFIVGDHLDKLKLESILRSRKTFFSCVQLPGQNVPTYVSVLEKLVKKCCFNIKIKTNTLKVRFVYGLRNGCHRNSLKTKMSKLSYTEIVKMATKMEVMDLIPSVYRRKDPEPHPIFGPKVITQIMNDKGELIVIDANGEPLKDQKRPFMIPYTPGVTMENLADFMKERASKRLCTRPESSNTY